MRSAVILQSKFGLSEAAVDENNEKFKRALDAAEDLFSDKSVGIEATIELLEMLVDEIKMMIESLDP